LKHCLFIADWAVSPALRSAASAPIRPSIFYLLALLLIVAAPVRAAESASGGNEFALMIRPQGSTGVRRLTAADFTASASSCSSLRANRCRSVSLSSNISASVSFATGWLVALFQWPPPGPVMSSRQQLETVVRAIAG
jgi:hypothetical protein